VLVFTNDDVLKTANAIQDELPDITIVTDTNSSLMENRAVSSIVELLNFQQTGEDFYAYSFLGITGQLRKENEAAMIKIREAMEEAWQYADKPGKYIKELVKNLGLFSGDLNVLKFIEVASNFKTIEDLVYNLSSIKESII